MNEENQPIRNLFFKRKPVRILVKIRQKDRTYARELSKDVDATYAHTVKILKKMNKYELIRFEPEGRKKIVRLTQAGKDIAKALHQAHIQMAEKEKDMENN